MANPPNLQPTAMPIPIDREAPTAGNVTPQQVAAYLDANPQIRDDTAQWLRGQGEQRSVYQWVMDDANSNPQSVHRQQIAAWQGGTLPPDEIQSLIDRANAGDQEAIAALQAAGYELASDTEDLPIEQGLLQTALPGLMQDVEGDAGRRALAGQLAGDATSAYRNATTALSPEANAARLLEEYRMADLTGSRIAGSAETSSAEQLRLLQESINARQQALTTEIATLRGAADALSQQRATALQAELDKLTAAQAPLAKARLEAADAAATGVNLGLQSTMDQLTATRAKQGYLGSSTFDAAALARAGIKAKQDVAGLLGTARTLNASDVRDIGVHGATEGRSIADQLAGATAGISAQGASGTRTLADLLAGDTAKIGSTLATQKQGAMDSATLAKQGYFDNAYTRGLSGTLALPGLTSSLAGSLTSLDNYGQSGLNRSQGLLNWWATPSTAAPVTQAQAVQADNSGNQIASLGSSLLGGAIKAGSAANWWQTPKTTTAPKIDTNNYTDWSSSLGLGGNEPSYSPSYQ